MLLSDVREPSDLGGVSIYERDRRLLEFLENLRLSGIVWPKFPANCSTNIHTRLRIRRSAK